MTSIQFRKRPSRIDTQSTISPPQGIQPRGRRFLGSVLVLAGLLWCASTAPAQNGKVFPVGAGKSMFRDVAESKIKELTVPFGELMLQHTGLKGQVVINADALELADQLDKGKVDLGLFHGFEFAWAQKKFPKLKPLMLAVNHKPYVAVQLVTKSNSNIAKFEDLKGKKVSLPLRSGEHCHLFVDRHCEKAGSTPEKFFGKIVKHESFEDSLDDVARGTVDAAIVDSQMLEFYGIVKPGVMPLLKTIEKTAPFPAAVVVFKEGALSQQNLEAFSNGMAAANKDPKSKGLMTLWKLTAFEPIPADYQAALDKIRTAYPAPAGW